MINFIILNNDIPVLIKYMCEFQVDKQYIML